MICGRVVIFTDRPDEYLGELCYHDGHWRVCVDGTMYHIERRGHWFRDDTFHVIRFEGADTAAIGGGTCWWTDVSGPLHTERAAIVAMTTLRGLA